MPTKAYPAPENHKIDCRGLPTNLSPTKRKAILEKRLVILLLSREHVI
jgi:hypothetical protein